MTMAQMTNTLADQLRANIERDRVERTEAERRAAEQRARRRIADFTTNLALLKQDFIKMVVEGKPTLKLTVSDGSRLFSEFCQFNAQYPEDNPYIAWVASPTEPALQPAWLDFEKWVTDQGLVLAFKRELSQRSDEEDDFVIELGLPEND
jgi:hypothetical protein